MSHLDLTREWLGNVLRPYQAKERIINEVMKILSERKTLSVKTDAFTFDSGQTALLLLLHGTLPINYRGATYHIPIHVWVPHDYPKSPPLLFVVPTKEMGVRKSKEVDPSGRIREEVAQEWWRTWPTQDLETILRHLTNIFSAAPPVYAKPPEPSSPAQSSRSPISSPGQPRSQPQPQASIQGQPPPPPTRPGFGPPLTQNPDVLPQYRPAPTPPPHPFPQGTHSRQSSATYPGTPPQHPASPPAPNRPARIPQSQAQSPISQVGGPILPQRPYIPQPQHQIQSQAPLPYPSQQPMSPPRSDVGQTQGYPNGYQPPAQGYYPPQMNNQSQQSQPPIPPHPQPAQQPHQPTRPPPAKSLVPPRQPIPDLLGSPEPSSLSLPATTDDSSIPPPLPPSKPPPPSLQHLHSILLPHLQASLPPLVHSLQSTQQHLLERKEDLVSGEPAIKDEMARLEAVKKVCDSTGRKLAEVVQKGEDRVNELEGKGEIGVDELVCGISIVHNQLIDLVAEDNAIEDTIYHMTRALDAERVDLDRYLKSIRSLAREQYMKRALIERILQGMGQTQGW